jgi:hypothetical protein
LREKSFKIANSDSHKEELNYQGLKGLKTLLATFCMWKHTETSMHQGSKKEKNEYGALISSIS